MLVIGYTSKDTIRSDYTILHSHFISMISDEEVKEAIELFLEKVTTHKKSRNLLLIPNKLFDRYILRFKEKFDVNKIKDKDIEFTTGEYLGETFLKKTLPYSYKPPSIQYTRCVFVKHPLSKNQNKFTKKIEVFMARRTAKTDQEKLVDILNEMVLGDNEIDGAMIVNLVSDEVSTRILAKSDETLKGREITEDDIEDIAIYMISSLASYRKGGKNLDKLGDMKWMNVGHEKGIITNHHLFEDYYLTLISSTPTGLDRLDRTRRRRREDIAEIVEKIG